MSTSGASMLGILGGPCRLHAQRRFFTDLSHASSVMCMNNMCLCVFLYGLQAACGGTAHLKAELERAQKVKEQASKELAACKEDLVTLQATTGGPTDFAKGGKHVSHSLNQATGRLKAVQDLLYKVKKSIWDIETLLEEWVRILQSLLLPSCLLALSIASTDFQARCRAVHKSMVVFGTPEVAFSGQHSHSLQCHSSFIPITVSCPSLHHFSPAPLISRIEDKPLMRAARACTVLALVWLSNQQENCEKKLCEFCKENLSLYDSEYPWPFAA